MEKQILKDLSKALYTITHELYNFSQNPSRWPQLEDGDFNVEADMIIINEEKGMQALTVIFDALDVLKALYAKINQELEIDRAIEEPDKIYRYIRYIQTKLNNCISLIGVFGQGYEDVEGNYISLDDFRNNSEAVLKRGLDNSILLERKTLKECPRSITYRKLILAIAALLNKYKDEYEELKKSNENLEFDMETRFPILQGPRLRMVLLKEMGVLEQLEKRYETENVNQTKKAELLALMLGFSKKSEIEAIRKDFYDIIQGKPKTKQKGGRPINPRSVGAVSEALKALGIEPKNLPEKD